MRPLRATAALLLGVLAVTVPVTAVPAPASVLSSHEGHEQQNPLVEDPSKDNLRTTHGAVASEAKECSAIGRDLLKQGGNAIDAIVGTTFCVGVVGMYHSGIGGGGFLLVRDASGAHEAIDFRETAPAAAHKDMYRGNSNGSLVGGLAVAVPGEVRGLEYAHARYGRLPWKTVLDGAVRVARDGFVVSSDLVRYMDVAVSTIGGGRNFLLEDPEFARDFAPNGTLMREGDVMTRRRYADTLARIAEHGSDAFYAGPVAESIIATIQARNGTMTLDDLRDYNVTSREPITTTFRDGFRLVSVPAPASGAVALQILKIMELFPPPTTPIFDTDADDYNSESSTEARHLAMHRLDEAMRFAYAARLHLADPEFVPSVAALEARMLAPTTLRDIAGRLRDDRTQPVDAYDPEPGRRPGTYVPDSHGTSHVATADAHGMVASLTTTVNYLFGSLLVDPLSGVILNNEMDDFSKPGERNYFNLPPSSENYVSAGKRPLSSISPIIVERLHHHDDDDADASTDANASTLPPSFFLTLGAAGGSRIATATAQVAWRVLEHGASVHAAIAAPRLHDQLLPNETSLEWDFDPATARSLARRGHALVWVKVPLSAVQGVAVDGRGSFEAASETRQRNSRGYVI